MSDSPRNRAPKDTLSRCLALLQLIPRHPRKINAQTLCERLQDRGFPVGLRTVQRDMARLGNFPGLLCEDAQKPYCWSFLPDASLNLPNLDEPSAVALLMAEGHLQYLLPQSVMRQMRPQFEAARRLLGHLQKNELAHWSRRVRSLPNGLSLQPAEIAEPVWIAVSTALLERRQLRVCYLSRSKGQEREFSLHPAGLVSRHSITYLIATVNDYQDLRQFALHRIQSAELLEDASCEHQGFDVDQYIAAGAFSTRQSSEQVELIADIHPQIAWLLAETPLSNQQTLSALLGSNWQRLHARVPLDQEIFWWICGLNDHIRVHAPQVWVEEIRGKVERLRAFYGSKAGCDMF